MSRIFCIGMMASLLSLGGAAWATSGSQLMRIQGRFTDGQRYPLTDTMPVRFSVWDTQYGGGRELWQETQSVAVQNNMFQVVLGRMSPIPAEIFSGSDRWLEMQIGNNPPIRPRRRIPASYYAQNSQPIAPAPAVEIIPSPPVPVVQTPPSSDEAQKVLEQEIDKYKTTPPPPKPTPKPVAKPTVVRKAPISAEDVHVERLGSYHAQSGDTLKSIAKKLYGNADLWYDLYYLNKDRLGPSGHVFPGQTLVLPDRPIVRSGE